MQPDAHSDPEPYTLFLMDMDGAFLHGVTKDDDLEAIFLKRAAILDDFKNTPGEKGFGTGSNRQDIGKDTYASFYNSSVLSFPLLPAIAERIGAEFFPFLMPDAENNLETGASFERAKASGFDRDKASFLKWKAFDETKISVIYAAVQAIVKMKGDERFIIVNFYDDRDDILMDLTDYFTALPCRLPANVQLNLYKYKGKNALPVFTTRGSGRGNYPDLHQVVKEAMPLLEYRTPIAAGPRFFTSSLFRVTKSEYLAELVTNNQLETEARSQRTDTWSEFFKHGVSFMLDLISALAVASGAALYILATTIAFEILPASIVNTAP